MVYTWYAARKGQVHTELVTQSKVTLILPKEFEMHENVYYLGYAHPPVTLHKINSDIIDGWTENVYCSISTELENKRPLRKNLAEQPFG